MSLMRQRAIKPPESAEKLSPSAQVRWDLIVAAIAVLVIVLDQISKVLVVNHFHTCYSNASVPIIGDILTLQYVCNQGTAFSLFYGSKVVYFLIAVAAGVIVWLYISTRARSNPWLKITFGMIIGGAVGNIIDRVILGYVRDFIYFQLPAINFKFDIFNIADSSIVVGMIALALIFWTLPREREDDADEDIQPAAKPAVDETAAPQVDAPRMAEQPMTVAEPPASPATQTRSDTPPASVIATSGPARPARTTTPVARANAPVSVPRAGGATSLPRASKYPNTVKSKRKKK